MWTRDTRRFAMLTKKKPKVAQWSAAFVLLAIALCFCACTSSQKAPEQPAQAAQKTFASLDDAAKALVEALKADNREALLAIFGPQCLAIVGLQRLHQSL